MLWQQFVIHIVRNTIAHPLLQQWRNRLGGQGGRGQAAPLRALTGKKNLKIILNQPLFCLLAGKFSPSAGKIWVKTTTNRENLPQNGKIAPSDKAPLLRP